MTTSAEARIATDRAARYLEQLCSHLGAMQHMRHMPAAGHGGAGAPRVQNVEKTGNHAVVRFADGSWELEAADDALVLRVAAHDDAALERLKGAIAARITKIGQRDGLSVTWLPSTDSRDGQERTTPPDVTGRAAARSGRRGWRRLGWLALAAAAAAIHLGLISSLLGGGRSKDIAADAITTLIAVKLHPRYQPSE